MSPVLGTFDGGGVLDQEDRGVDLVLSCCIRGLGPESLEANTEGGSVDFTEMAHYDDLAGSGDLLSTQTRRNHW